MSRPAELKGELKGTDDIIYSSKSNLCPTRTPLFPPSVSLAPTPAIAAPPFSPISPRTRRHQVVHPALSPGVFSPTPPLAAHPPNPASIPRGSTRPAVLLSSSSPNPNRVIHLSRQGSYELAHSTTTSPKLYPPCAHEPDSVPHNAARPSNASLPAGRSRIVLAKDARPICCCRFNSNV